MLEVKSLIEKEKELDQNVGENKQAVNDLLCLLSEFSKKKSETLKFSICGINA